MDGKEHGVRCFNRLPGRTRPCVSPGVPCKFLELLFGSGVAEHYLMSGSGENGAELSAHQSRSKYPYSHDDLSPSSAAVVGFKRGFRTPVLPPAGSREGVKTVISRLFAPVPRGSVRLER